MAEALKHIYSKQFVHDFSNLLTSFIGATGAKKFKIDVLNSDWENKELKQRMWHLADCMAGVLTGNFKKDIKTVLQITDSIRKKYKSEQSFEFMFIPEFVSRHGLNEPELSVRSFESITQLSSCEFAVRPFLVNHQELVLQKMLQWSKHKEHTVRRFSSEGCRPRLPWGAGVPQLKKNPEPVIPILENLKTDQSLYVRKSVANNLNDISKEHPEKALKLINQWKKLNNTDVNWIIKHGSRTLLKSGNEKALKVFGQANTGGYDIHNFSISGKNIKRKEGLNFNFELRNTSKKEINFRIEYVVYYKKTGTKLSRKIFKISETKLKAGDSKKVEKKINFNDLTTRKHYAGEHQLAIVINGKEHHKTTFNLQL